MEKAVQAQTANNRLKEWVDLYADALYSWALFKTSSRLQAEDIVQDVFMSAFESLDKFENKSKVRTWLFAILNNKINDYYRHKMRDPIIHDSSLSDQLFFDENDMWKPEQRPAPWPLQADQDENVDFHKTLQQCLEKLPKAWFAVIDLKYSKEKKTKYICQEMNITATNLWQMIHRAKLNLRKCIELNWFLA